MSSMDTRTIVITGAGSAITRALVKRFASAQTRVVIVGSNVQAGGADALQLQQAGCVCSFEPADVRDAAQCAALVRQITASATRIDAWINASAVTHPGAAETLAPSQWEECMSGILGATFFASQSAARHMLLNSGGVIVNIASMDGCYHQAGHVAPGVAMAGVIALTQALGIEWAARGVRVVGVAHGALDDDGTAGAGQPNLRRIPMRRAASLAEVAEAVFYLAGPQASYVVGETLRIDGGFGAYQLF